VTHVLLPLAATRIIDSTSHISLTTLLCTFKAACVIRERVTQLKEIKYKVVFEFMRRVLKVDRSTLAFGLRDYNVIFLKK